MTGGGELRREAVKRAYSRRRVEGRPEDRKGQTDEGLRKKGTAGTLGAGRLACWIRFRGVGNQYMPPMSPMPGAGAGAGGSGLSATRDSVVSTMPLTEAAFSRAQRVTLAGSTMPEAIMSQ